MRQIDLVRPGLTNFQPFRQPTKPYMLNCVFDRPCFCIEVGIQNKGR